MHCRDHPRGCGAHFLIALRNSPNLGSSPRVRGSPPSSLVPFLFLGIIPAGAGLTPLVCKKSNQEGDHPRGCGAHSYKKCVVCGKEGSSPRVRGSLSQQVNELSVAGIIPAGAGLTLTSASHC